MPALVDTFGRTATDLRISVTDRCDLRCTYCMPEEGLTWTPRAELLTFDEIERLARIMVDLGVKSIRITGGEPLMRSDLPQLISQLARLDLDNLSMTTNGTTLERHAKALKDAGLNRVNISLDSLERHRFNLMTRRDRIDRVLAGITQAAQVGLNPVKLNCVVIRGVNDDEVISFAEFSRTTGCHIRLIEYMPLDADQTWTGQDVVPSAELVARIDAAYPLTKGSAEGPSTVYRFVDGAPGSIATIPSVTEPFCDRCDRLRLTADGHLRSCLFATDETDLRALLRDGHSDESIVAAIVETVKLKQAGHGIGTPAFIRPRRSMSMIGG